MSANTQQDEVKFHDDPGDRDGFERLGKLSFGPYRTDVSPDEAVVLVRELSEALNRRYRTEELKR